MKNLRKFNEIVSHTQNIKIFIVLYWFWEGDGYLINEYKDCFLSLDEAIKFANTLKYGSSTLAKHNPPSKVKVYLPNEEIPDEEHGDGKAFAQIIEKVFVGDAPY